MNSVEAVARGWSIIPVDPNKKPLIDAWKAYQQRRPNADEIAQWSRRNPPGWAVVTGRPFSFQVALSSYEYCRLGSSSVFPNRRAVPEVG